MRNWYHRIIKIFSFCFLTFISHVNAQAIKIYVSDAETGKNISNAKVCLEGFAIPAINLQYSKKAKYYYANKIPANYNTVMVYHKKYNEKGFQNVNGLPKELTFKLHEPYFNYYDFDNSTDGRKYYETLYIEDPYKIVIKPKGDLSYKENRERIIDLLQMPSLSGLELINPFWELKKMITNYKEKNSLLNFFTFPNPKIYTNSESYPILYTNTFYNDAFYSEDSKDYGKADIFPTKYGFSSDEAIYALHRGIHKYDVQFKDILFFLRRKDGKKFKRFNDKIIEEISKNNDFEIQFVLYKKNSNYISDTVVNDTKQYFTCEDDLNQKFNLSFKIDSSKIFFNYPYFDCVDEGILNDDRSYLKKTYVVFDRSKAFLKNNIEPSRFKYQQSTGLGILDLYEYYDIKK